jgi:hypothetical protein
MTDKIHPHTRELARVTRHIMTVQALLRNVARQLLERADFHDLSKFAPDELGGMIEIDRIADEYGLNSPQYMEALQGKAIQLHRSRHTHHPEYHKNGLIEMSTLDIIEMICDWKAANMLRGHPEWNKSVNMMADRLNLSSEQQFLIKTIAQLLEVV